MNDSAYGGVTYGKTATVLLTLEKIIGEDNMAQACTRISCAIASRIPRGEDFMNTVEEVAGQDLRWYFEQAISGTQMLDYKILDAHSDPVNWYEPENTATRNSDVLYRTYVTVQRKDDFVFPVDVKVTFDDKQSVTRALGRPRPMGSLCLRSKVSASIRGNRPGTSDLAGPRSF